MNNLELELKNTRLKWLEAHKRGDTVMCSLWEKVGKHLKYRIQERLGSLKESPSVAEIENIFGGKLQI
jgi:hypothetical protein